MVEAILLALEEVKVKTEAEEAPQVIIIIIQTDLTVTIGEEAEAVPLKETTMANQGIETPNTKVRIGKIDSGETKMDKVGAIITEIMTIKASVEEAGKAIIITGHKRTIIEVEAVAGIDSKTMIRTASLIGHMGTITHTPSHNHTMTTNPDQHSHNKQPRYVNCVTIKDTLTTNANLQVTLWLELSKPLTKADNSTTKMHKVNDRKGITIMKTPTISLFSRVGS